MNTFTGSECKLKLFFLLPFCLLCLFSQAALSGEIDKQLAGVKTIYLQSKGEQTRLIGFLSVELSQKGYIAATDKTQADAILKGWGAIVEIVLDDRPPSERTRSDPDICKYEFELVSKDNLKLWQTSGTTKVYSHSQGSDKKAAARIISKLDKAIKSAIRKQALKK